MTKLLVICTGILLFCSCENEVDVYGDYKETAVVFGLLDAADTIVRIRISKTYQTEGGAAIGAANSDAFNFRSLTVKLRRNDNEQEVTLTPNTTITKQPGFFSGEKNGVYEGPEGFTVVKGKSYTLTIINNDNGNRYTSEATVINGVTFSNGFSPGQVGVAENIFEFYPSKDTYVCDMMVRMHYRKINAANPSDFKDETLDYPITSGIFFDKPIVSSQVNVSFKGKELVHQLRLAVPPDPGTRIKLVGIDYLFTGGARELRDYLSLFRVNINFVQKTRQYSNITNGLGIFSSRNSHVYRNVPPSTELISAFKSSIPEFID